MLVRIQLGPLGGFMLLSNGEEYDDHLINKFFNYCVDAGISVEVEEDWIGSYVG